ncbi:MAG: hypothetical protein ACR2PM_14120 [Hyphomicrobiales bacterium]
MTLGMPKKSIYFLMAFAVVMSITTFDTISVRMGHALVPFKLEVVNRIAKGHRLSDLAMAETVARGGKAARLATAVRAPAQAIFVTANRATKASRLARHLTEQRVARSGKTAPLAGLIALRPKSPSAQANQVANAGRLSGPASEQLVARSHKTDTLRLIFAELKSLEKSVETVASITAPPSIDSGVSAQGGTLVFVPVTVPVDRLTNVVAEPIDSGAPAKTLWN